MSLNKVMLIGNVGADPEVRYLDANGQNPSGNATKMARIRLATTERYRDRNSGETRENTEWHTLVAWRNQADIAERYVHKGSQIFVEGRLRTRQWTDQSGNKREATEIAVDNLQLLGRRQDGEGQGGAYVQGGYASGGGGNFAPRPAAPAAPQAPAPGSGAAQSVSAPQQDASVDAGPEDDLPF